jgi:hypothetical protein
MVAMLRSILASSSFITWRYGSRTYIAQKHKGTKKRRATDGKKVSASLHVAKPWEGRRTHKQRDRSQGQPIYLSNPRLDQFDFEVSPLASFHTQETEGTKLSSPS